MAKTQSRKIMVGVELIESFIIAWDAWAPGKSHTWLASIDKSAIHELAASDCLRRFFLR